LLGHEKKQVNHPDWLSLFSPDYAVNTLEDLCLLALGPPGWQKALMGAGPN
jgi:hypothetical protein